jgi:thioredoxin reductase
MKRVEVVVVGAGPAGLSAAAEAVGAGADVLVLDENAEPGGQLFKQIHKFFGSREHRAGERGIDIGRELLDEVEKLGVEVVLDASVWGIYEGRTLAVAQGAHTWKVAAERVVLATGATESGLAFRGWTLPGVMGAGCAQTMMNVHRVLPGQKVLMVGSGNVGLIVAYQLLQAGAEVVGVVEALPRVGGYPVHAAKIARAGVPIYTGYSVKQADGDGCVAEVTIWQVDERWRGVPGSEITLAADTVTLAVGLSPMAELAWLAGCRFLYVPELGGHVPVHSEHMETTVPGLFVAGDVSGVEEASSAMEEGRLAGLWAAADGGRLDGAEAARLGARHQAALDHLRSGPFGRSTRTGKKAMMAQRDQARSQLLTSAGA